MKKTFTTFEILNITSWYKKVRQDENKPLASLPLSVQWEIKKNINKIQSIADDFVSFKDECEYQLREEFSTDDKSIDDKDEQGQPIKKVKDEYLEEFYEKSNSLNSKLTEILSEKTEFDINTINIENLIENLPENTLITIDDLDMLSFMSE